MHWHECGVGETTTAGRCKCRNDVEVVTTGSEQATTRLREAARAAISRMCHQDGGPGNEGPAADLIRAIEDAAVAAREAELRAEIAAMKGDLFRKSGGTHVWVQRAAVLALLEAR